MSNSLIQLWDGTNRASVNPDGTVPLSLNSVSGATVPIIDTTANAGLTTIVVGLTATQILSSNTSRRASLLFNKGTSNIWLGLDSSVRAGASAVNLTPLGAGANLNLERYNGALWGIIGPGVANDVQYLGTLSIG